MIENQLLAVPKGFDLRAVAGKSKSGKDMVSGMMVSCIEAQGGQAEFQSTSSILRRYAITDEGRGVLEALAQTDHQIFDENHQVTPHGLFRLGLVLQDLNGPACLTITLVNGAIRKYHDGVLDSFYVNGMRRREEGMLIRQQKRSLIWVSADDDVRFQRAESLGIVKRKFAFYEMERAQLPQLSYLRRRCTTKIYNNGTEDELFSKVVWYMMKNK